VPRRRRTTRDIVVIAIVIKRPSLSSVNEFWIRYARTEKESSVCAYIPGVDIVRIYALSFIYLFIYFIFCWKKQLVRVYHILFRAICARDASRSTISFSYVRGENKNTVVGSENGFVSTFVGRIFHRPVAGAVPQQQQQLYVARGRKANETETKRKNGEIKNPNVFEHRLFARPTTTTVVFRAVFETDETQRESNHNCIKVFERFSPVGRQQPMKMDDRSVVCR